MENTIDLTLTRRETAILLQLLPSIDVSHQPHHAKCIDDVIRQLHHALLNSLVYE